jgi:hypothetical protein
MSATLSLTREGTIGFELRRGHFDVQVDGNSVGSIDNYRDTFQVPVEPGHHDLRLRRGRYSSRDASFDAADGETVRFRCHGVMVWPRWLMSFALPNLGIALIHEH